jgi:hypothetical protein
LGFDGFKPLPPPPLPAEQALRLSNKAENRRTSRPVGNDLRRRIPHTLKARNAARVSSLCRLRLRDALELPVVDIVRLTVPVLDSGIETGLKEQAAPWGSPEQENCTVAFGMEPYVLKLTGMVMLFPAATG